MQLSAKLLKDVQSVNSFVPTPNFEFTVGDPITVYFELIDTTLDLATQGFNPPGRRYIPATGATLYCSVESIADDKTITRFASQPFPNDGSVWALTFMPQDTIKGTANLRLRLTEGSVVRWGLVKCAFRIHPNTNIDLAGIGTGYSFPQG